LCYFKSLDERGSDNRENKEVTRSQGTSTQKDFSPLFQPARVLVRFDDIARIVEKPNHGAM